MTAPVAVPDLQVDPAVLSDACRKALEIIHDLQPHRTRNGYGSRLRGHISLKTVQRLQKLYLVRMDISRAGNRLMLTGRGLNTYFVMMARRERKAGR